MSATQIKTVNWHHEALADLMINAPHMSLGDMAKQLGFSIVWLSIVKNSDSFKDYFALRRRKHEETISTGIREKAAAVAEMALDVILEDTATKIAAQAMSAAEARENLDLVARRFGFDGTISQQRPQQQVVLNVGMVTQELLDEARERAKVRELPILIEEKKQ